MLLPTGVLLALSAIVETRSDPGLLRVPKVYNAVITSNQNLAPSRAYPVIQPVVHRTAIGYVPPFYYPQIPPGYAGPGVIQLNPESPRSKPADVESVETSQDSGPKDKIKNDETSGEELSSAESTEETSKRKTGDRRVPLNFYPNYRSVYYDPYFYPYNAFAPNLATPGTYYVDYSRGPPVLGPIPGPLPLQPGISIVPSRPDQGSPKGRPDQEDAREEKQKSRTAAERRESIPDVPPPPIPIAVGKKDS